MMKHGYSPQAGAFPVTSPDTNLVEADLKKLKLIKALFPSTEGRFIFDPVPTIIAKLRKSKPTCCSSFGYSSAGPGT